MAPSDLPAGRFRSSLEKLPVAARQRALDGLKRFSFPPQDVDCLHASERGDIYYACEFSFPGEKTASERPAPGNGLAATLPIAPFPGPLKFHSRPGATNVIFLDFDGHAVTGTDWNWQLGRDPINAVAFSTDDDYTTYSDSEQAAIKSIWQRVAEDYAPFDVDVTTEEPVEFNDHTARALITRSTDATGAGNPAASFAGGVAYTDVFGRDQFAYWSPAWIYVDRLGSAADRHAEVTSHEIGHNLGLSHDGTSSGAYYSGHGSGDTSWSPIMGAGIGMNVSQWSRGEYYQANNTQDDLFILARKLVYRADDHANGLAGATPLAVVDQTNVWATTPETDPANTNPANKGIISSTNDADVFVFSCGVGAVNLAVNPWVNAGGSRGGNLDVLAELHDAGGSLLARADPTSQTFAVVSAVVTAGVYYLQVSDTATGNPLASPPDGYTAYASIGQYFITGTLPGSASPPTPPGAALLASDVAETGQTSHTFSVTYSDDIAISGATLDSGDVLVTGPSGYSRTGTLVSVDTPGDGPARTATYGVEPPGATWKSLDSGLYTVSVRTGQVADTEGAFVPPGPLGSFTCRVPAILYSADLAANPGWKFTGTNWAFGRPAGIDGDPASGYTGAHVIGFNLNGNYPATVTNETAMTPAFSCAGADTVTLRFQRMLGVAAADAARIQISTDGVSWSNVWSASAGSTDLVWRAVSHDLTPWAAGRTNVQLRWLMHADDAVAVSFGWNIDEVEILATGTNLHDYAPVYRALTVVAEGAGDVLRVPAAGAYPEGSYVDLVPLPSNYFAFAGWGGAATGMSDPLTLVMAGDLVVTARFVAVTTTNFGVPHGWLAEQGITNDFESAAESEGANGRPLWESYVAGLVPGDPASEFEVSSLESEGPVIHWTPVSGRVYEVHRAAQTGESFLPLATDLAWPAASFTDSVHGAGASSVYQLRVRLP